MLLKLDALSPDHLQTPVRTRSRRDLPLVEEIDPLSLIEIKSAIQWKEMSKRISFNFDQEEEKGPSMSNGFEMERQDPVAVVKGKKCLEHGALSQKEMKARIGPKG